MKKLRKKHRLEFHKEQKLKRKNFFPTLLVTIVLWASLFCIVYFIDPDIFAMVPLFFILAFLTLLFTVSLVFASGRRGLIGASAVTLFLFLSYLGIGNYLNLILILAIGVCLELYFSTK